MSLTYSYVGILFLRMARLATTFDVFNALAEPARRDILSLLARGEQAVNAIVETLRLTQPSVSKHLRVLATVRLVNVRQMGRQRVYAVNVDTLRPIVDWVGQFDALWEKQLTGIKAAAEAKARASRAKQARDAQNT